MGHFSKLDKEKSCPFFKNGPRSFSGVFMWELYNCGIISKRNRKVIQFDIHGIRLKSFDNCNEAAKYVGAESSNINRCCNGKIKTSMGFVWKYEAIVK